MNIAVNTRYLLPDKMEGFGVYSHEILSRVVAAHPEDKFTFFFDRPIDTRYLYSEKVEPVMLWPPARHPLLYRLWYQTRLKRKLEKYNPDVFFSPDSYMPLGLSLPTVLTVHDVAPRRFPEHLAGAHRRYYLRNMPVFLDAASRIITVSEFSKLEISSYYDVPPEKITVIHNGVGARFKPVDKSVQRRIRDQYSGGKPFFLYVGAIHPRKNVDRLVRAFDAFKNIVQSDLQLLIAGVHAWKSKALHKVISRSAAADAIHQIGYVLDVDLPDLVGSASAMCYVSLYEGFGIPVLEAMACGTPVITSSANSTGAALAEVTGDAALHVDPLDTTSIAAAMQRLHDDSRLQATLIQHGLERATKFSWDQAADATYSVLKHAAGN